MIELVQYLPEILTIIKKLLDEIIKQSNRKKLKNSIKMLLEEEILSLESSMENSIKCIQKLNVILENINNLKEPEKEAEMLAYEISNNVNNMIDSLFSILKLYLNHKEDFHIVFDNSEVKIFFDGLANTFKKDNGRYIVDFDIFINYLLYAIKTFNDKNFKGNMSINENINELYKCIFNIFGLILTHTNNEYSKEYNLFITSFNKKLNEYCPIINDLENSIVRKFSRYLNVHSVTLK
ncbi:hypothetical protein [Methanocaldococcus fervens]|uniref:Uncharacterized protein n=1 Tax=Methanocaldococcus fervens (strain DSM 4213 / JCM 15782 / AG86) TaxID=573064 RepID=C7P5V7_METFA|nr:hypothetical protein [Methanocaldococcus fervens]ACV23939.1 hypothetical protein Mefer_0097 [Methanocaldococcus fervens AG86]